MKYTHLFLLLIMLVLWTIGCTSSTTELNMKDLRKGTDALVWSFLDNQPPTKVFEQDKFLITVDLHNNGASPAQNTYLVLGVPQQYISLDISGATNNGQLFHIPFTVKGKSLKDPKGESALLLFPAETKSITTAKKQTMTITGQLCYDYETLAETDVCVNYNPSGYFLKLTACKPKSVALGTQGGPVAVSKIDVIPKYFSDKSLGTTFIIAIQNRGQGKIIESDRSGDACSAIGDITNLWDWIDIAVVLGGKQIHCKKEHIKLEQNKAEITCEGKVPETAGPYVTPLQIYLNYGYTQTISKQMTIERT